MRRYRFRLGLVSALPLAIWIAVAPGAGAAPARRSAAPAKDAKATEPAPPVDPSLFQGLEFRLVGPYRGGRVTAVTGVPADPGTYYMGSTGGGVWKTTDGGLSWGNVSDKFFETASVGAVAVAPGDPNVVYAGMGSACIRGNVSAGDGVYRSTDAGKTWTHLGLDDAGQIGRIRVDPRDPDRVYVAVLGHAFGPNETRGVFRSTDGGRNWEKVLFVSDTAGAVDLSMDASNPRILYAAFWEVVRKPWTLESGGPGSGLWKSSDGGDTWKKLEKGLPKGLEGRIGVAASPARPDRVWALVEAEDGGLFRSDDGGDSFRRVNPDRRFRQRAWYYTHVYADPVDENTVYILNTSFYRSTDGGKSFDRIRTPHGDNHDLWLDPSDPRVMIESNDGGAAVSTDGGHTWTTEGNQPTAEFYRVTTDDRFPYRIYGAQQDNSTVAIASAGRGGGITERDWYAVGGGESGYIAVDPRDPDIVYAGSYGGTITRYDHATGEQRSVMAYPQLAVGAAAKDLKYRFQWNAPIVLSPHDPKVLYHCANVVLRSTDEGRSWQAISPDLTRNDPSKQGYAGGPITKDDTGVEVYDTIFAFAESPVTAGELWAGSDDGLLHLSRDGGAHWQDVTPKAMPAWATVNSIDLSSTRPGRALVAAYRYRQDDFRPYVFLTEDYGQSWRRLTDGKNGIPDDRFVRVVREDPGRPGLLFAGTEQGLYVSFDDGARWQPFQLNLPVTPVTDLAVHGDDLVVATQGRALWVLDDLAPLRQLAATAPVAEPVLFTPPPAFRTLSGGFGGGGGTSGKNPPNGAVFDYLLPPTDQGEMGGAPPAAEKDTKAGGEGKHGPEVRLEILDGQGKVVRGWSSEKAEERAPNPFRDFMGGGEESGKLPAKAGHNRFVWDLREPDGHVADGVILWGLARGPRVAPGTYRVRLTRGDRSATQSLEVRADPRLSVPEEAYEKQLDLARKVLDAFSETQRLLERSRSIRGQVDALKKNLAAAGKGEGVEAAAEEVDDKLEGIEGRLHQTRNEANQDPLNFPPQLDNQLLYLYGNVAGGDAAPSPGAYERFSELAAELAARRQELAAAVAGELSRFNQLVSGKGVPPVVVPKPAD